MWTYRNEVKFPVSRCFFLWQCHTCCVVQLLKSQPVISGKQNFMLWKCWLVKCWSVKRKLYANTLCYCSIFAKSNITALINKSLQEQYYNVSQSPLSKCPVSGHEHLGKSVKTKNMLWCFLNLTAFQEFPHSEMRYSHPYKMRERWNV